MAFVEERVIDIVCENLGVNKEQVTRQTSFQEDIGADSLERFGHFSVIPHAELLDELIRAGRLRVSREQPLDRFGPGGHGVDRGGIDGRGAV